MHAYKARAYKKEGVDILLHETNSKGNKAEGKRAREQIGKKEEVYE